MTTTQIETTPLTKARAWTMPGLSASALLEEAKLLGSAPEMREGSTHSEAALSALDAFVHHLTTTLTANETFRRVRKRTRPLQPAEAPVEDNVDRANNERIELLARQYVAKAKFSSEEQARLAIVTERVRQLLPAVTVAEFEALEKNLEASRQVSGLLTDLRARLARLSGKRG